MGIIEGIDFYRAQTIIAALGTFMLGVISILKNSRNKMNIVLALFNFMVMSWMVALFLLRIMSTAEQANILSKFSRIAILFIPFLFLYFVILFTKYEKKWIRFLYFYLLFSTLTASLMNLFGIGVKSFVFKSGYGFVAQPDLVYFIFIFNLLIGFTAGIYTLTRRYLSLDIRVIEKKQIQYLMLAFIILTIFAIINILNIFGFKIYPVGSFGGLLYTFIITYAVLNYDLLRIKELFAKVLVYLGIGLVLTAFYIIFYPGISKIADNNLRLIINFIIAVIAVFFVNRLYGLFNKWAGIILLSDKDIEHKLYILIEKIKYITTLKEILIEINQSTCEALNLKCSAFLVNYANDEYFIDDESGIRLSQGHPLIKLLYQKRQKVYFEEMNNRLYYLIGEKETKNDIEQIITVMRQFGAAICFPIFIGNNLKCVWLLGERQSKNIYSREEIKFIDNLIYHLAMRIENIILYEQLANSERLVMLGKMAAAVAHEIRNPITGLGGFVEMMAKDHKNNGTLLNKFLEIAPAEFKRLEKLTDNLLALSHTTRIKPENIDIDLLIDNINLFLTHVYKMTGVTIIKRYSQHPFVFADKEQVAQVILNLVINALQSMPEGGCVEFDYKAEKRNGKDYELISIKDSGIGIDENIKEKIFEPFFTTKSDGSGLGLTISKKIMETHGGIIELETQKEKGSIFYLLFPRVQ